MAESAFDAYWRENPQDDYWYYSRTLRTLNPQRTKSLLDNPKPWACPKGKSLV